MIYLQEYKMALKDHEGFVGELNIQLKETKSELEEINEAKCAAEETAAQFKVSGILRLVCSV